MNRRSFSGNTTLVGAGLAASSVCAAPPAGGANREGNSPLLRSMKGKIRMHKPAAVMCLAVVGFIVSAGVLPAEKGGKFSLILRAYNEGIAYP